MRLRATRTRLSSYSEEPEEVQIELELIVYPGNKLSMQITEGAVTGYEAFVVNDMMWGFIWKKGSCVFCAGTEGRWDRLEIPATEMARFVNARGLCHLGIVVPDEVMVQAAEEVKQRFHGSLRRAISRLRDEK